MLRGRSSAVKNVVYMIGLIFGYLVLLIVFKNIGLDDFFNVVLSSLAFGATLKLWVSSFILDLVALSLILLIYFLAEDFYLLLVMLISCTLGYWAVRMYRHQQHQAHPSS